MSCHRYQNELSQCLDGRLPGARRAVVMAHVDQCPRCQQAWEEMQAAQTLIYGLDQPRVGADFRDRVWSRIHAGEGAPPILLQEPIGTWHKVRYGLVGAAAAAVFLFGLHLVTRADAPAPNSTEDLAVGPADPAPRTETPPDPAEVAVEDRGTPRITGAEGMVPDGALAMSDPFGGSTMAASRLAHVTAQKVTTAARQLRSRRDRILRGPVDQPLREMVDHCVQTIEDGLQVLDCLQQRDFVTFAPASQECLISLRNSLQLDRDPTRQGYNVVRTLSNCSLDGLDKQLKYTFSPEQLQKQEEVLLNLLQEQRYRRILTERLQVLQQQGPGFVFNFSGTYSHQGFMLVPLGTNHVRLRIMPWPLEWQRVSESKPAATTLAPRRTGEPRKMRPRQGGEPARK